MKYELVNPLSNSKRISSDKTDENEAAFAIWNKLNKYTKGHVKESYFSIQQTGGKLHHYKVKEHVEGDKVEFTLSKWDNVKNENEFSRHIDAKTGGYRKSDSSSSSDSDSDTDDLVFKFKSKEKKSYLKNEPLIVYPTSYYPSIYYTDYLYYYPWVYNVSDAIVLPTFKSSLTSNIAVVPIYTTSTKSDDIVRVIIP